MVTNLYFKINLNKTLYKEMSYLFHGKTTEGYVFKIITEVLLLNLKTCCLTITEEGVFLNQMDTQGRILFNIKLPAENFEVFKFNYSSVTNIGLNLAYLHKMLKTVKKKDKIEFFIKSDNENNFGIKVTPNDNSRVTTSYINIHNLQSIDITFPEISTKSTLISSSDFQKTMKEMNNIGNLLEISKTMHTISFKCITNGIFSKEIEFGNINDNDGDNEVLYCDTFNTETFYKLMKLSGVCKNIHIFAKKGEPLMLTNKLGDIGDLSILIKSNKMLEG